VRVALDLDVQPPPLPLSEEAIRNVALLMGEDDTQKPTSEVPPSLRLTRDRQKLLTEVQWVNVQPWSGQGGAYNRLGYLAFLGVAWRVNRLTDLGVSVREFGEWIGTKSIATANRVQWRILDLGLVRRREEELEGVRTTSYRYDLQLQSRYSLSTTSLPYLNEIVPSLPLVPEAFWTKGGLSKASLRLYEALDPVRWQTRAELAERLHRNPSSVSRLLRNLFSAGLAEPSAEGWRRADADLDLLAQDYGTTGIREEVHRFNQQQRAAFTAWIERDDVPQARAGSPKGKVREELPRRSAKALQRDHAPRVQPRSEHRLGHPAHVARVTRTSGSHLGQEGEGVKAEKPEGDWVEFDGIRYLLEPPAKTLAEARDNAGYTKEDTPWMTE
jgi:predicted transcriptional regulator